MLPRKYYFQLLKEDNPKKHERIRKQWEKDNLEHRRTYKRRWARRNRAC